MRSRNNWLLGIWYLFVSFVFVGLAQANSLLSIDCHLNSGTTGAVIRAYPIDGDKLGNPVTFSEEIGGVGGAGPVGISASTDLELDMRIYSCYNKIILLSATIKN